jgi:hypothetical protein
MIDSRCEEVLLSDSRCLFLIYVERVVKKVDVEGTVGRVYRVYTKTMRDVKKEKTRKKLAKILMTKRTGRWGNSKATSSIITSKTVRAD